MGDTAGSGVYLNGSSRPREHGFITLSFVGQLAMEKERREEEERRRDAGDGQKGEGRGHEPLAGRGGTLFLAATQRRCCAISSV